MASLKETWGKILRAIGLWTPAGMVGAVGPTILDDPVARLELMAASPEEQATMLHEALQAAPEFRQPLAEASAAWDTWKHRFVVNRMRQSLGPNTTEQEMGALIAAYRRLGQWRQTPPG